MHQSRSFFRVVSNSSLRLIERRCLPTIFRAARRARGESQRRRSLSLQIPFLQWACLYLHRRISHPRHPIEFFGLVGMIAAASKSRIVGLRNKSNKKDAYVRVPTTRLYLWRCCGRLRLAWAETFTQPVPSMTAARKGTLRRAKKRGGELDMYTPPTRTISPHKLSSALRITLSRAIKSTWLRTTAQVAYQLIPQESRPALFNATSLSQRTWALGSKLKARCVRKYIPELKQVAPISTKL